MGTAGAGTKLRALVVGGAVGGLTTAIALRRAGVDVSVFEQSADARITAGRWGLGLWSNAVRSLQQLGLAEGVLAAGPQTEELRFQTAEGKHLATWPIGDLGRTLGAPSCSISPDALLRVLTAALDDDSVVQRNAKVEGFTQDPEGVTLKLADGREERGDFLVGADGLRSTIRKQILGESAPRYSGYWVWQSIIDFEHEGAPIGIDQLLWGHGARFAFHHVEENKLFWQVIINTPEEGDGVTSSRRENLIKRFEGWRPPVQEAIGATAEEEIRGLPIYDRNPSKQWGIGRATLLGDAAHPMTNNLGAGRLHGDRGRAAAVAQRRHHPGRRPRRAAALRAGADGPHEDDGHARPPDRRVRDLEEPGPRRRARSGDPQDVPGAGLEEQPQADLLPGLARGRGTCRVPSACGEEPDNE